MLTALSSGWLWGSRPFEAGDSNGSSRNERAAKRGERETGEASGGLKKASTSEEIAAAVKEACKPLQAIDPNEAAKELWQRLKSLEGVLTLGYSAIYEAKEFLDKLEGLIKNYSSPLGEQRFNAIATKGLASKETRLKWHVSAATDGPHLSFYYAVGKILEKDAEQRKPTSGEIAAAVKAASKSLEAFDANEAAKELWERLKSLQRVLNPDSAKEEAKEFLNKLEGLIKNYSSPLGEEKFNAIALDGEPMKERTLIKHVDAAECNSPYFSFYFAVEKILEKDRADRLTSSSACTDASVTLSAGPSPSSTLFSEPTGSVENKSPEIIAAAVRDASKPLTASDPNEAAKELWGRLKELESTLTPGSEDREAKEFLGNFEGLIKNYSKPLGEQRFEATAFGGAGSMGERTLIKHVGSAMCYRAPLFYYAVQKILEKDAEQRNSSIASPLADASHTLTAVTGSTLSSQPASSMEKNPTSEEIAAAVKAASKPLKASDPKEAAKKLWRRLKKLERVLTPDHSAKVEAKEFLDNLEGLIKNYSSPLGEQKFSATALEGQTSEERTLIKHVDAAESNSSYFTFYWAVEQILDKDLERRASSAATPLADASHTLSAGTSRTLSFQPTGSVKEKSPEISAQEVPSIVHEKSPLLYDDGDTATPSASSPAWVEDGPLLGEGRPDSGRLISGRSITYVGAGIVTLLVVYFGYDLLSGSNKAGKTVAYTG